MKIGDLIRMRSTGSVWLVMDRLGNTVLAHNVKTNICTWMNPAAFEVINASR
jgi:hypothetical protein